MGSYLIRRLLLVIPTLWAIITINFFIVQIAPGGPVDQAMPEPAQGTSARGTIAVGGALIRKSSPRSPTATALTSRCTSVT